MNERPPRQDPDQSLHQGLASFRRQLRKFLLVSENAVNQAGLHPQQHQLLLAVAGVPADCSPSIAYAAESLGLKHNTVVELVDRCVQQDLLERTTDPSDRRRVCLRTTARGQRLLKRLSQVHLQELDSRGPLLIESLQDVLRSEAERLPRTSRKKARTGNR